MKGDVTVQTAVKAASRVSKRSGKWANLAEIKSKAPTFKEPMSPVLSYLVRNARVEKKKGFAFWRPRTSGYGANQGKGDRGGESTRGGTDGGRRGGETSGTRGAVARGIAGGAVGSSVTRILF